MAEYLDEIVLTAYMDGIAIQGDYARANAQLVAAAASLGFITTRTGLAYSRYWRPTPKGMEWMQEGGVL